MAEPEADHNRAIATEAKTALAPLRFRRKGQSRTWLADHRYWLLVIEFQPSAWSKGSYLNVAAHWLWRPPAFSEPHYHLSFDFSRHGFGRVGGFIELEKRERYDAIAALAETAASEAQALTALLPSVEAAAGEMIAAEQARPSNRAPHWGAYDAAVSAALSGRPEIAAALCRSIMATPASKDSVLHPAAALLLGIAHDSGAVRAKMEEMVSARRAAFRLPPVENPFG